MSKAEKLRKHRERQQFAELAAIPRREKPHREGGKFARKKEEDPRKAALDRRCLRFGIKANDDNRARVSKQHMCCDLGFVIEAKRKPDDVAQLWDVFSRWCRAEANYQTRYVGQSEGPQSAAITLIHETMETDPSLTVDSRTQDERDRDAVNGWMRWRGFIGHLSSAQATLLHQARRGEGALWTDGSLLPAEILEDGTKGERKPVPGNPTPNGIATLEALCALMRVSERKKA